jgi:hypothetical protein
MNSFRPGERALLRGSYLKHTPIVVGKDSERRGFIGSKNALVLRFCRAFPQNANRRWEKK